MNRDDFLTAMRSVLASEREAIRRLDGSGVTDASRAKETLLAEITNTREAERAPLLRALAEVREELKRNLVLLAHARDCLRDTLARARSEGPTGRTRLSVEL